ncbi:diaminohydroxyphosphoribosylamino-pyrimidine deaminase [Coprinopsis marcescibilis]|uniref:Diaminohydroxyphosphoribosylamino-pyrimidine deaminase n=1 Tax=Coprinopsis marcescibilis TaxID=230819 RepID=A0A5C3LAB0_COPMA|nr:diaminohydroxyphosphoribosylamino-pyrimidine deaminase [Coprinopsis marcescibilis]
MEQAENHIDFMKLALFEAKKAVPTPTAFCVGCVLVTRLPGMKPVILSTGYSRELPGNTHAEANSLDKARRISKHELASLFPSQHSLDINQLLAHTDVYTTLEPCSVRTSGLDPCAGALIDAKVRHCIIGVNEPPDFVRCEGASLLRDAGIQVTWLNGLEQECLRVARGLHSE